MKHILHACAVTSMHVFQKQGGFQAGAGDDDEEEDDEDDEDDGEETLQQGDSKSSSSTRRKVLLRQNLDQDTFSNYVAFTSKDISYPNKSFDVNRCVRCKVQFCSGNLDQRKRIIKFSRFVDFSKIEFP